MIDNPILSRRNILVLHGIYPKDFDHITNDVGGYQHVPIQLEASHINRTRTVVYGSVPKRFTTAAEWPKFSNLKCWECDLFPESYPKFIPLNPEVDGYGRDVCDSYGNFDEWECAAKWVAEKFSPTQRKDILDAMRIFESKFTGKTRQKIPAAPSKTLMKAYCGELGLTEAQYKEKRTKIREDYSSSVYKLEHLAEKREGVN